MEEQGMDMGPRMRPPMDPRADLGRGGPLGPRPNFGPGLGRGLRPEGDIGLGPRMDMGPGGPRMDIGPRGLDPRRVAAANTAVRLPVCLHISLYRYVNVLCLI